MHQLSVYFVGQPEEVAHHAAPFQQSLNVQIAEPAAVLRDAIPGDLAIFFSEHFDRFRDCCLQLKQRNVATLYLMDGILEWRNAWENRPDEVACPYTMRPVLAHKVACIGESQARVLNSWGNAGKTEIVGIPRLDEYFDKKSNRDRSSDTFRVLVMTAKTPGFTPEQIQTTRQSLLDLKHWLTENPTIVDQNSSGEAKTTRNTEFIWRLTADLANEIGVENQLSDLTGKELAEVLVDVDAVISTPSTAMLEAMRLGLPTAVLDYHNCPHYVTAGWDICSPNHIGPSLGQMIQRSPTRMMFQHDQLNDSLYLHGPASERLVELVAQMISIAGDQIASGLASSSDSLSFPPHVLEPATRLAGDFRHEFAYPDTPEFSIDDKTILQIELSHARREISHLHRELAQIQSELDQAHQIFEQIEKHPIAGPIVRIRQKMLDLMAAIRKRKNKLDSTCPATATKPAKTQAESPLN
jgi:hypothetical protein